MDETRKLGGECCISSGMTGEPCRLSSDSFTRGCPPSRRFSIRIRRPVMQSRYKTIGSNLSAPIHPHGDRSGFNFFDSSSKIWFSDLMWGCRDVLAPRLTFKTQILRSSGHAPMCEGNSSTRSQWLIPRFAIKIISLFLTHEVVLLRLAATRDVVWYLPPPPSFIVHSKIDMADGIQGPQSESPSKPWTA